MLFTIITRVIEKTEMIGNSDMSSLHFLRNNLVKEHAREIMRTSALAEAGGMGERKE